MKELIDTIREHGWNAETRQATREALINCPVGRPVFYDIFKCFHEDISAEEVIKILSEIHIWEKDDEKYFSSEYCLRPVSNVILSTGKREMHRKFHDGDIVEFWHGTTMTRAKAFLSRGDGYTALERPVNDSGRKTQYGIQVMLEDYRSMQYGERASYVLNDVPAVIHGFIAAEYLFPANNPNEYGIPWFRYDKIMGAGIIKYSAVFF